jgi:hypothetical protein
MRGNLFRLLLAVSTTLLLCTGTAQATPLATAYAAGGGPVPTLGCTTSLLGGDLNAAGTQFVNVEVTSHQNCLLYGYINLTVSTQLPWQVAAIAQSGTVTNYTISNIGARLTGPGCQLSVAGTAAGSYNSATSVLTVVIQSTIVTSVSASAGCLGLVSVGQSLPILSTSYTVLLY